METGNVINFESFGSKVGRFNLKERTILIPEMNRMGSHLLAANFRSFGIRAKILETFED